LAFCHAYTLLPYAVQILYVSRNGMEIRLLAAVRAESVGSKLIVLLLRKIYDLHLAIVAPSHRSGSLRDIATGSKNARASWNGPKEAGKE
jgi:hypothetical protein